jgi:hypothetical protein
MSTLTGTRSFFASLPRDFSISVQHREVAFSRRVLSSFSHTIGSLPASDSHFSLSVSVCPDSLILFCQFLHGLTVHFKMCPFEVLALAAG